VPAEGLKLGIPLGEPTLELLDADVEALELGILLGEPALGVV
jgi:hypothetical protein